MFYSAMSPLSVVSLVVLLSVGTITEAQQQDVFPLGHNFDQYDFSCTAGLLAALSENRQSLLFYDIVEEHFVEEKKLPLPGELLKWSPDGQHLVITQDSYMTVLYIHSGVMKTVSVPVVQASSVIVLEDLACIVPAFDQWTNIVCMNLTTFQVKTCFYLVYAGALAFADSVNKWVYMLDQGLDPQSVHKFSVGDGCLNYTRDNPVFGEYYFGNHIWYSYDGSRIFLNNGLTLTASSNPKTDMQVHGDFNSSTTYQYSWFSQSGNSPYLIAGLRSDLNDTVVYYTWPYLRPSATKPIPLPKNATKIVESYQVHACYENSLFVFSNYEMTGGVKEMGVAYMTI